jgi:tRNA/rRNA methyltransferase
MILTPPCIILVRPQMGENIGAAARAMLNFDVMELRIVNPRDGWPNIQATQMAAGALEKMPPVQVYDSLASAVKDCHHVYATTARPRDMVKPVMDMRGAVSDARTRHVSKQKTAFVFGPERTGLDNDEVALCHTLITIPTNPEFWSLNLGQATLLMAYEWMNGGDAPSSSAASEEPPATHEKIDEFLTRLKTELEDAGFFRSEGLKPTMKRNIRNIFMRNELSDQDVRTLQGILSALIGKKNRIT